MKCLVYARHGRDLLGCKSLGGKLRYYGGIGTELLTKSKNDLIWNPEEEVGRKIDLRVANLSLTNKQSIYGVS